MDLNDLDRDWKKEAPKLAAVSSKNPYTVPDSYFGESQEQIIAYSNICNPATSPENFTVPENYFENLSDQISSRIALEETLTTPSFTVPENYFGDLSQRIIAKTQPAKIRKINPLRSWISYAAAAVVLVAISTGILINKEHDTLHYKLSNIPDQEIINYLEIHADAGDTPEIIDNLDGVPAIGKDIPENTLQQAIDSTL